MPLLGICRGMQLLNVARGGTLHQHLPDIARPRRAPAARRARSTAPTTTCASQPGSLAARAAGEERPRAPSPTTTRASTRSATGLVVTGWAELDELPEAIERPDRRFALGVQWHPEADERSPRDRGVRRRGRAARAQRPAVRP